jgi:biotin carboxylase
MSKRRLFFIGIPETHVKRTLARCKKLGYEIIIGDTEENLQKYSERIIDADQKVVTNFKDEEDLRRVAQALNQEKKLDAIFTFKEFGLVNTSKIIEDYNLQGNKTDVIEACNDKFNTRNLLRKAGLASPDYQLCKSLDDVKEFWTRTPGAIILKPHNLQGSIGVFKIENEEDIFNNYEKCLSYCKDPLVLAEEFISGQEISIEAIVYQGEVRVFGITEKILYPGTFVEAGHVSPYEGSEMSREEYTRFVEKLVKVMGIQFGPLHIEGFHTENGFYIGEIHTRYGGDNITTLTEIANKCDMTSPIFAELGNIPYEINFGYPQEVAAIRFLDVPPGKVSKIELGKINDLVGVVDYEINCKVGDEISSITSNFDRVGWILAKAGTRKEVETILCEAFEQIQIQTV